MEYLIVIFSFSSKLFMIIGKHIVQLFVQFAPYDVAPSEGSWTDDSFKNAFADRVIKIVDEYAPGTYVLTYCYGYNYKPNFSFLWKIFNGSRRSCFSLTACIATKRGNMILNF